MSSHVRVGAITYNWFDGLVRTSSDNATDL